MIVITFLLIVTRCFLLGFVRVLFLLCCFASGCFVWFLASFVLVCSLRDACCLSFVCCVLFVVRCFVCVV